MTRRFLFTILATAIFLTPAVNANDLVIDNNGNRYYKGLACNDVLVDTFNRGLHGGGSWTPKSGEGVLSLFALGYDELYSEEQFVCLFTKTNNLDTVQVNHSAWYDAPSIEAPWELRQRLFKAEDAANLHLDWFADAKLEAKIKEKLLFRAREMLEEERAAYAAIQGRYELYLLVGGVVAVVLLWFLLSRISKGASDRRVLELRLKQSEAQKIEADRLADAAIVELFTTKDGREMPYQIRDRLVQKVRDGLPTN